MKTAIDPQNAIKSFTLLLLGRLQKQWPLPYLLVRRNTSHFKSVRSGRVLALFLKGFIFFELFVKSEHQSVFSKFTVPAS